MILHTIPNPDNQDFTDVFTSGVDHHLYIKPIDGQLQYPAFFTRFGIVTILNGKGTLIINDEVAHVDEHSFLILNKGSNLEIKATGKQAVLVLLYFNHELSEFVTDSLFRNNEDLTKFTGLNLHDFSLVEHIHYLNLSLQHHLSLLIELGKSCASFHSLKSDMIVRSLLDALIEKNYKAIQQSSRLNVRKIATRITLYKRLSMVKNWIEKHYMQHFSTEQLADISMVNQYHFIRLFKQTYKISPRQYVNELRLNCAKDLLDKTELSITTICYKVGYESLPSFTLYFKKRYGLGPQAYRKRQPKNKLSIFDN